MSCSLKGFMTKYCQELTGLKTTSLKKLFNAVLSNTPRAFEAVVFLAIAQKREDYLQHLSADTIYAQQCSDFISKYHDSGLQPEDFALSLPATDRFGKAAAGWRSYITKRERDQKILKTASQRMLEAIEDKGITKAQASRQLGLDKSNFCAFLRGDVTRISKKTIMEVYSQLVD